MDENNGTRIFWSTRGDGGKTWAPQAGNHGVATSASPALASDGVGTVYMAWKGANPDTTVWWSKCNDGKKWTTQQRGPVGAIVGPAAAVDGNKSAVGRPHRHWGRPEHDFPRVCPWNRGVFQLPLQRVRESMESASAAGPRRQPKRPALIPTGSDSSYLMLAWRATGGSGVSYSRLLLPAQIDQFSMPGYIIKNMRTGHAGARTVQTPITWVLAAKVSGQPVEDQHQGVGRRIRAGSNAGVGVGSALLTISPGDILYFHYGIINSSAGTPIGDDLSRETWRTGS